MTRYMFKASKLFFFSSFVLFSCVMKILHFVGGEILVNSSGRGTRRWNNVVSMLIQRLGR